MAVDMGDEGESFVAWTYTVGHGDTMVADCIAYSNGNRGPGYKRASTRDEAESNARLIAAAPTQHKALTATDNPDGGEFDNQRVIRMAITALFSEGHKTLAAELEAIANDQALAISKATQP
jgi:hypothetical protein